MLGSDSWPLARWPAKLRATRCSRQHSSMRRGLRLAWRGKPIGRIEDISFGLRPRRCAAFSSIMRGTLKDVRAVPEFGTNCTLVFIPHSDRIVVSDDQVGSKVFDLNTMKVERSLDGWFVRDSNQEGTMIIAYQKGTGQIALIDTTSWEVLETRPAIKLNSLIRPVLASDWSTLVYEPKAGYVAVREHTGSGELALVAEFMAHKRALNGLALSPDKRLLAACSETGYSYSLSMRPTVALATTANLDS